MSFLRLANTNWKDAKANIMRYGAQPNSPTGTQDSSWTGSLLSLFTKGSSRCDALQQFDNGVDPLGRLSRKPPPAPLNPSPVSSTSLPAAPQHWVDELFPLSKSTDSLSPPGDLMQRIKYFLQSHGVEEQGRAYQLALYVREHGEAELNAKLFRRFGEGLPLRVPGQTRHHGNGPVPRTLRELLRTFMMQHDPRFLDLEGEEGLDGLLAQASQFGMESLESRLIRKYGVGVSGKTGSINNSPSVAARENLAFHNLDLIAAAAPSKQSKQLAQSSRNTAVVEVEVDSSQSSFYDEKALRADLTKFYEKHDLRKAQPEKLDPIVQWAYKIGPAEFDNRFQDKYGESLTTFVENKRKGIDGVTPGPKPLNATMEDREEAPSREETDLEDDYPKACEEYQEMNPSKGFGVCKCGQSRADHRDITSLLVVGNEQAQFTRAKAKTVVHSVQSSQGPTKACSETSTMHQHPTFQVKDSGKDGPCGDYRIDLEGRFFGMCKCGWTKQEHQRIASQRIAWIPQSEGIRF